ncbi:MAG TPA: DUF4129 domain-containing protein [Limnochordia bacterium]|nr:DUF4129 domain-containing protein [Limnochordia bacterium]
MARVGPAQTRENKLTVAAITSAGCAAAAAFVLASIAATELPDGVLPAWSGILWALAAFSGAARHGVRARFAWPEPPPMVEVGGVAVLGALLAALTQWGAQPAMLILGPVTIDLPGWLLVALGAVLIWAFARVLGPVVGLLRPPALVDGPMGDAPLALDPKSLEAREFARRQFEVFGERNQARRVARMREWVFVVFLLLIIGCMIIQALLPWRTAGPVTFGAIALSFPLWIYWAEFDLAERRWSWFRKATPVRPAVVDQTFLTASALALGALIIGLILPSGLAPLARLPWLNWLWPWLRHLMGAHSKEEAQQFGSGMTVGGGMPVGIPTGRQFGDGAPVTAIAWAHPVYSAILLGLIVFALWRLVQVVKSPRTQAQVSGFWRAFWRRLRLLFAWVGRRAAFLGAAGRGGAGGAGRGRSKETQVGGQAAEAAENMRRLYAQFLRQMRALRLERRPYETAKEYARRVEPFLDPGSGVELDALTAAYERARYTADGEEQGIVARARQWLRRVVSQVRTSRSDGVQRR